PRRRNPAGCAPAFPRNKSCRRAPPSPPPTALWDRSYKFARAGSTSSCAPPHRSAPPPAPPPPPPPPPPPTPPRPATPTHTTTIANPIPNLIAFHFILTRIASPFILTAL